MIDDSEKKLINRAIDDELSATEFVALDELLEQSPEAQQYHTDLQRMDSFLKESPLQDPPRNLHNRLVDSIVLPKRMRERTESRRSPFVLFGLAASIFLMIAVGIYQDQANFGDSKDIESMIGTMAPQPNDAEKSAVDLTIQAAGLTSLSKLQHHDDANILNVTWESDDSIDVLIDLSSSGLRFEALAQMQNELEFLSVAGPIVRLRGRGRQRVSARFRRDEDETDADATIKLEFSRDGTLIQRGLLAVQ